MFNDVCAGYHQYGEVLKVPMFIEHFMEYEGNLSEFVMEHYDNHKKMLTGIWTKSYHLSIHLSYLLYMLSFLIIPLRSKNLRKSEFPKKQYLQGKRFLRPLPFQYFPASTAFLTDLN